MGFIFILSITINVWEILLSKQQALYKPVIRANYVKSSVTNELYIYANRKNP